MGRLESQLASVVARIIGIRRSQVKIHPSWIATEALDEIDPGGRSVALVSAGCHLQLRQIARDQCRKLFDEDGACRRPDSDPDYPMFPMFEQLQWRYPVRKRLQVVDEDGEERKEPEYVLLEHMTGDDVDYNVARLEAEATAKVAHARALRAWWRKRRRTA
jgi:hypothetical protein